MDSEQWRKCYSVFRAMHDSTCPVCGFSEGDFHKNTAANSTVMLQCPNCGFEITHKLADELLRSVPKEQLSRVQAWKDFAKQKRG